MKIRVLIIEDNPITADDLSEILAENHMEVLGAFANGQKALKEIPRLDPDILLVDIKLKGELTGIDVVRDIVKQQNIPVIYLTANSDPVTVKEAINTSPAAFLTKPFEDKDVVIAIELAFKNHLDQLARLGKKDQPDHLFIKGGNRFEKVPIENIHYFEADGSYCKGVTAEKEYILTGHLNQYTHLNESLLRVHRSYIVNLKNVSEFDNEFLFVDQRSIPIGRSYRNEVRKHLKKIS